MNILYNSIFYIAFLAITIYSPVFAQTLSNQDCINAIPVCQNVYNTTKSYTGQGNILNEISTGSCLASGEKNDVWYIITVASSGFLNFTITPNNAKYGFNIFCLCYDWSGDDYDWIVYDLSNVSCSDLKSYSNVGGTSPLLSCNYSDDPGPTGTKIGSTVNSTPYTGSAFNAPIAVTAGQTIVLSVSNFTTSQSGYKLDFSASTASIIDNVKPSVLSIEPQCNSTVKVKFSENVLCSTVDGSDFTVTGPGGPYTANITASSCLTGSAYENDFELTISPPFEQNGTYTVALTGTVTDNCGNVSNLGSNSLVINNSLFIGKDTTICSGQSLTLNATTAGATSYTWSNGSSSPTINVTNAGKYSVVVKANGCTLRDTIVVSVLPTSPISVGIVANNNNICVGKNVQFTATPKPATGLSPNYQWYVGATAVGTNSNILDIATLTNNNTVKVVMTTNSACVTGSPATSNSISMTVNQPSTNTITTSICDGESFIVGSQTFNTAQTNKKIILANANSKGCDSTITLNLTINPKSTSTITTSICQGESIKIGNQTFTTTQLNKTIVLANANSKGCDSTITLNLTVNPKSTSTVTTSICQGESIKVGNQTFTTTQLNKTIVLANANSKGCDSTITLNLTVNPKSTSTITTSICQGESIKVGNQTFTTTQLNKTIVLANSNSKGCDSTITLNLTVNPKSTSTITTSICDGESIVVGSQTFITAQKNKTIVLANANSNGCDSTITLNLTINPTSTLTITTSICQGESIKIGNQTFTTTQTNKTIVLANANSNGCDSTITLNLTINPKSTSTITTSICQGESIKVGNQTFNTAQTNKTIVLANANSNGCDSTITLNLTILPKSNSTITTSICQGESIKVGNQTFTTSQTNKTIVLDNANSNGCDSTIILNLTVNPKSTSTIITSICDGESIVVGSQSFTTAQTNKKIILANANSKGCDSTITLNLTINPKSTSTITTSICQGESIKIGNQTFTTTQLNKTIVLANANSKGCDSTITLNLTVNPKSTSTVTTSICQGESIKVGNQTFTTTQLNKTIVLANANSKGCDSTITLNLTVNFKSTSTITTSICQGESIKVGNQTFTTSQTNKTIVLDNANSNGCDSTITLNLTVNPKSTSTITTSICNGESIVVGSQSFTTAQKNKTIVLANANSNGCDSTITLNLTINPTSTSTITTSICQGESIKVGNQTFTTTQTNKTIVLANANSNGCDSTITLNLTILPKSTSTITTSICQGESIKVGNQTFNTAQTNKTIVLANANSNGCDSTITLNLTILPKSNSTITTSICDGQSIVVGNQTFTTTQNNKVIVLANASNNGCDSVITLNLTIQPKIVPTVNIVAVNNDICSGGTIKLLANASTASNFQWFVNSNRAGNNSNEFSSATLNDGDEIKVIATTTLTCTSPNSATSNTINAIINKINYTKPIVEYCMGDNFQVDLNNMSIKTTPNPNYIISWTNGSQITTDSSSQYSIDNSTSTNIPFQIRYGKNCRVNDVLSVKVNPLPNIDAIVNKPAVRYEEVVQFDILTSSALTYYNWIPADKVSNAHIVNPTSEITASVLFRVNVVDNKQCKNSDSVYVELIDECVEDYIFVPTGFSPNNDGLNDCFSILSPPKLTNFSMTIFNRWGEKVYETFSEKDCWNGTKNGVAVPSDSYPYIIKYKCYNGNDLTKKGVVNIVR